MAQEKNEAQANGAPKTEVKRFQENTITGVLSKIEGFKNQGNLQLPPNYAAENAVRSAWLIIQQTKDLSEKPALDVCTHESVANALLEMVLKGLSPAKKQCYFIVYGNKLTLQESYFGKIAMSKRVAGVKDVSAVAIYEGDKFAYSIDLKTGNKTVTQHEQDFMNIDPAKVKGAYAIVTYEDDRIEYEVMTMPQIRSCWELGKGKGNTPAHRNFPDEMAKKTAISRALKIPVNSSNDDDLFEDSGITKSEQLQEHVGNEITQNANTGEEIGFEEVKDQQPEPEPVQATAPTVKAPF